MRIAVSITEGEVTLTGELPNTGMIAAAIKVASEVDGVVAVASRLTAGPVHDRAR